jgi:hypothetical protein
MTQRSLSIRHSFCGLVTIMASEGQRRWHNPQKMHLSISFSIWPRVIMKYARGRFGYIRVAGLRSRLFVIVLANV